MDRAAPDRLTLRLGDHAGALWWLALLYRRPRAFVDALQHLPRIQQAKVGLLLWLHVLPYVVLLSGVARAGLLRFSGTPWNWASFSSELAFAIAVGIAFWIAFGIPLGIVGGMVLGTAYGIAFGIAVWIAFGIPFGILLGIAYGIAHGISFGIAGVTSLGIAGGIAFGILFAIALGIVGGIAFGTSLGIAGGIGFGIVFGILSGIRSGIDVGIAVGIAGGIAFLRAYYLFLHPLFVWPALRGAWYPRHPVAWDNLCAVPFPGLDRLLAAYTEQNPAGGQQEIERLISSYPSQRAAALRARTRLLAREAGRVHDLAQLSGIAARLPEGQKGFLRQNPQVRAWLEEIAHQQLRLNTVARPVLREPLALNLVQEIENFGHRLGGFEEPLRTEFRAAALKWEALAKEQLDEARCMLTRQPVRQVFRAGDPVDRESEAFVPRDAVLGDLDQQVELATGCPGVVLYARRRMGKSTLLRNLTGFLPQHIQAAVISLQDPTAFTSLEHLVARIVGELPAGDSGVALPRDLPGLQRRLEACNARLKDGNGRLLLALDEYEQLDVKIGERVFPQDLLAAIRESIQSHRQITWLFAGSHEITELPHAPWTSYLVSARTIEVPPFTLAETRLLLTEPLKHSELWKSNAERPHFSSEFWGEGGIERIQAEADGWPHLLQLIAETVVDLLNSEAAPAVTRALRERALDRAVTSGHNVLSQLMQGESTLAGEWEYLSGFRERQEQPAPEDAAIRRSLRHRQIVREENGLWRLRVPLMARWLRLRG
jgi:hypothetical protein